MSPAITIIALSLKLSGINMGVAQPIIDHVSADYSLHGIDGYRPSLGIVLMGKRSSRGVIQVKLSVAKDRVMLTYTERF